MRYQCHQCKRWVKPKPSPYGMMRIPAHKHRGHGPKNKANYDARRTGYCVEGGEEAY